VPNEVQRILILGGTREARLLASRLANDARYSVVTSLAGRTTRPNDIAGELRSGGFGGVEGLRNFIAAEHIALMVDATHPYAAQISANAAQASAKQDVSCLRLERPPWEPGSTDRWTHVGDTESAARAILADARALVTVGRQEIAAFFTRADIHVVARMIEPPAIETPDHAEIVLARPPFSFEQECALMKDKRIDVLVTKNSGGEAGYAKLQAARELGLPVIMIARPGKPDVASVSSVEQMLKLIEAELG